MPHKVLPGNERLTDEREYVDEPAPELQSIDPVGNMVIAVEEGKVPMKVWITLLISSVGVFLASVSTSALIIAFPVILVDLEMTLDTLIWILLVIQLVICAVAGSAGKLGDIFGQATLYKFGYFVFVAASLGGGFSHRGNKGYDMLTARVIIGFGAAFLFTNSSAILTNAFAPYNLVGLSQGIFSLSSSMGMVLGPVIGGAFSQTNWRWIFFFNAPVGGPMVLLSLFTVHEAPNRKTKTFQEFCHSFDWVGGFFYPAAVVLLMIAMVQIVSPTRPLDQTGPVVALLLCGGFAGAVFIGQFVEELTSIVFLKVYDINAFLHNIIINLSGPVLREGRAIPTRDVP